ncbi:hypothetical protein BB559_002374 [Furculomyces boomerangus]|uniref:Uncharacterized protein n=2 Tax=Harpellales TaxID=61421 RepID=A0A2T9YVY2_9FUNG|nr:hypothetical protein BB559_002374 [Furculomyces boomerangus]PVZ99141.1 hypothetical protein BB558_004832 [Smittium angustum]PWA00447.1 hypothetical protein BB558_003485 [Smittium angustum]
MDSKSKQMKNTSSDYSINNKSTLKSAINQKNRDHNYTPSNQADALFYNNPTNILLFQKIRPFVRDLNLDKQVYNYHFQKEININSKSDDSQTKFPRNCETSDKITKKIVNFESKKNKIHNFDKECKLFITKLFFEGVNIYPNTETNRTQYSNFQKHNHIEDGPRNQSFLDKINQYGSVSFKSNIL